MKRTIGKIASAAARTTREYYYSILPDRELIRKIEQFPGELSIEPINICNANCIFCAYQYQERPRQRMSDNIFKQVITNYADMNGGNLHWTVVVGDPLLDPECVERIQYARSFSCIRRIETVTNCINLHRVGAERLLRSGLDVITVSTTGFDVDMYQRIYRNGHYEQMKENLLTLLRRNVALGRPVRVAIELRIDRPVEHIQNSSDFREVIKLADSVDANYYFDSWSGKIKPNDLTGNMKIRPNVYVLMKKRIPCAQLWIGIGVLVDGTVTACSCRDLNGDSDLVLGKINETSLRGLCHSERLRKLRNNWFRGEGIPEICSDCTFYYPYTYLMLPDFKKKHFANRKVNYLCT
ncbi:MAG: radical SAM/SPASM domain-containing protein [Pseudomonadota bacterium]